MSTIDFDAASEDVARVEPLVEQIAGVSATAIVAGEDRMATLSVTFDEATVSATDLGIRIDRLIQGRG